jgi:hypothetical protein
MTYRNPRDDNVRGRAAEFGCVACHDIRLSLQSLCSFFCAGLNLKVTLKYGLIYGNQAAWEIEMYKQRKCVWIIQVYWRVIHLFPKS